MKDEVTSTSGWSELARLTEARVGLGRTGVSTPTAEHLRFQADHAVARDAVRATFDPEPLVVELGDAGLAVEVVASRVTDRVEYLRRPDLGRQLANRDRDRLQRLARQRTEVGEEAWDVALIVSDGLSPLATATHAAQVVLGTAHLLADVGLTLAPVIVVPFARVGLLDDVGAALGVRCAAIVLGERPGLSTPDSLGVYFERQPRPGLTDADRNCLSNIRPAALAPKVAAERLVSLIEESLRTGLTGTALKLEFPDSRAISGDSGVQAEIDRGGTSSGRRSPGE